MELKYFELIISEMRPFLNEQGFRPGKSEGELSALFETQKAAASILFDETTSQIKLMFADIDENKEGDFRLLSAWLFDEQHSDRDAKHIALDFVDSLRSAMGVKLDVKRSAKDIELPGKGVPGSSPNIDAFCARFLAICPQYKDDYKEHILQYNELLYNDFFAATAVPHLKSILAESNKKQCVKFFEFLDDMYAQSDNVVGTVITAVILGGVFGTDVAAYDAAAEAYMADTKYLKNKGRAMISQMRSSAKTDALKFWKK